jgi:hypothetical protein
MVISSVVDHYDFQILIQQNEYLLKKLLIGSIIAEFCENLMVTP